MTQAWPIREEHPPFAHSDWVRDDTRPPGRPDETSFDDRIGNETGFPPEIEGAGQKPRFRPSEKMA